MDDTRQTLTPAQTRSVLSGGDFLHLEGTLYATYRTADFAAAVHLVDAVAADADAQNHHPDVKLGYGSVEFELTSHDVGGITQRDLRLALRIQELAAEQEAHATRLVPSRADVAIDCTDAEAVRPFWRVGLGYVESGPADDIELRDPRGGGPKVWFQHMEIQRTERNRIHLDVYVPVADCEDRVQDIIDVGGVLLTDEHAPDWWVLADPEGNELCVCSWDA
ncbi:MULTISPECIES: VOC family protein [unclassified Cryobacterium]|uniref:VOC family protein n=1 Tax=unclassified Cryobacterium TaxID=2649013 RepID=UPI00106D85DF|nr:MULTISPECIES: VOC family protein [unclassified Cryobacterium]TFC62552.1 4a-hydroxytetrahydrobiopterin dehydratase [Cryobacterium sp. TMB1-7]TFC84992.1 4a-hydroxytetrahydrobiopterin dehydratase [Cryobacterium sp. TMT4-31]